MKPLAPNSMIQNRYLVVHLIGSGGMGQVYLAVDQRLGNAVALKRTFSADDSNLSDAFEREARILARLRHPVLPKVIDHFSENGDQFLVMEHVSGDDLSKRLETSNKPFPLNWIMFWADQLLDSLTYLHSHEPPIIHRDIKPQNLKLTDENHIVLLDFGLSKDSGDKPVTADGKSGSIVGYTPHFAPMEQIRGTGTSARSDIYSLSATLYQLMTNTVPIDSLARADTLLGGLPDPLVSPTEINAEIPSMVSDVILKGLEVSQDKRFATAAEMQKALRRAYSQTQSAMSANTVAFSVADADAASTGNGSDLPAAPQTAPPAEEPEVLTEVRSGAAQPVLDATMQMNTGELQEAIHRSHDAAQKSEAPTAVMDGAEVQKSIPGVKVSEVPKEVPATLVAPEPERPRRTAPPAQAKAGKSRKGLVVGMLVGLLVLAGGLGAGGWFAYNKYYLPTRTSPTPLRNANVQPSPSPTESAVTHPETNANPSNTNPIAEASPAPRQAPPPDHTVSTKTNQSSQPKATPKPKTRDDRTVISQ